MAKSRTPRTAARKAAGKRKAARKTARARKTVRKVPRKAAKRRATRTVAARRKGVSKARPRARRSSTARKAVRKATKSSMRAKTTAKRAITKKSKAPAKAAPVRVAVAPAPKAPPPTTKPARAARPASVRKPALDRERRRLPEASLPPTPPSSLDLDQRASAARSGRREIEEHLSEHNETGPILTAGDVDADWEAAYSSGDEAPGGDNPTPDQDVVDEIGRSLGLEYNDNEELKGADKVEARDRHRWELDPASSEDYDDRE
jgi:Family of unknown function (DUF6335)